MILASVGMHAQNNFNNQFNQYGGSASGMGSNNYDRNGNPIDSSAVNDANTIPIGLNSWTIDEYFGNRSEAPVDTIRHGFQNSNDTGGPLGHFSYLGNLGSPRFNHIFFECKDHKQFFFIDPYDFSVKSASDVLYTNTKSPYANLTYYKQGNNRYGEERFKSYFAVNVNKRLGFGFNIDYIYGRGKYSHQSTALFNGNLFTYYLGDKYEMHFNFINENLKVGENGGITDDRYISNPVDMADGKSQYESYQIPTMLTDIWNRNTGYHAFYTHRYNMGFYRDEKSENDTINKKVFVPVTSIIHTLKIDANKRRYYSYNHQQNTEYFEHNYLGRDSTDVTRHLSVKNTVGLSLREGFQKWAKFGLTAFAAFEHRQFHLTDTITNEPNSRYDKTYKENMLSVGGQLIKEQGKTLHYNVLGEVVLLGEDLGQFNIEGHADLNFRLLKDTVRFEADAHIKNQNQIFYLRHFHSKHYWWDNELSNTTRAKVEGALSIDRWRTKLKVGFENIKNYTYLDNVSVLKEGGNQNLPNPNDKRTLYKNDVKVSQYDSNIQVFSASLRQDFQLGILHLDNEVTYQKSSNQDILPLPSWVLYHDLYLKFKMAKKVLSIELGADLRYFTKYYAPDYAPAIGQFTLQNPNDKVEVGNYPMLNAYVNLHLKRTRIFLQLYNALELKNENSSYFNVAHYPLNPRVFKFGISWTFFD